ncbi:hypothetical protein ACSBR1_009041 [Camellia fascicularis]
MKMKVEIIARETIKPFCPTPTHLRTFKLSLLDQRIPHVYKSMVFYYPINCDGDSSSASDQEATITQKSQHLKQSLSQILACFYPFAGRIKDHLSIDCNDEGVNYFESRVDCPISDVLEHPNHEALMSFAPTTEPTELGSKAPPLLLVQANFFKCGGLALAVSNSHKVADAATFSAFMKGWSCTALGYPNTVVPDFSAASRFPPLDDSHSQSPQVMSPEFNTRHNVVCRRYVFDALNISDLKAKAASSSAQHPSRVEVVTALLWKCAVKASRSRLTFQHLKQTYVLIGVANLRSRLVPPLPEYCFGNIFGVLRVVVVADDTETELDFPGWVSRVRKGFAESCDIAVKKLQRDDDECVSETKASSAIEVGNQQPQQKEVKAQDRRSLLSHSSLCRFPFYDADFGWGKPVWVSVGYLVRQNAMLLMDTREGDGVEAWVSLSKEEMALFERDPELLEFVSLKPSAL